ncbi:MAG: NADH-quinone oxidoreductase subunit M [Armatimonadetes bacterium]|nr:NADH-quinone oxidoreductase subunit M [Armatimonadota bacterium]MBX3108653.1 NADH-quinone oxidoreductase subunit M [Fimbriimonadaceae bacterium]
MGPITLTILIPLIGMVLLLLVPERFDKAIKWLTVLFTGSAFLSSLGLLNLFHSGTFHFQLVESAPWIPAWGIQYKVGIDGISIWLFMLTTLLTLLATVFSFYIDKRPRIYFAMMLLLEAAMLGVFVSMDMILFYSFFELTLIPMAVMIFIWGGSNRNYAAIKFFLYTFAASIFMLLGMIALAKRHEALTGTMSFDITAIQSLVASGEFWQGTGNLQMILFWAMTVALLVKCPMFPFHTWLPDAHTEAPTAGSVILAGVLLKMGTYGLLRFSLPFFPEAAQAAVWPLMALSVIGIIYGAAVAAVQPDVKKLVAYSSVAHMGFVVFGIFSLNQAGMIGGAYQQLNHGISTGALFLLIGLIYERTHTRAFKDYGGLKAQMPVFSALFLIVMLSSVGLPGMNGFVGEFLALYGGFMAAVQGQFGLGMAFPLLAGTGVILAAAYLLHMFRQVFYGPLNPNLARLKDLKPWEVGLVGIFIIFIFWGGLYPNTFLKPMERSIGAVRMMALNKPGERPDWADQAHEVDAQGNLVTVNGRTPDGEIDEANGYQIVAPADFYSQK